MGPRSSRSTISNDLESQRSSPSPRPPGTSAGDNDGIATGNAGAAAVGAVVGQQAVNKGKAKEDLPAGHANLPTAGQKGLAPPEHESSRPLHPQEPTATSTTKGAASGSPPHQPHPQLSNKDGSNIVENDDDDDDDDDDELLKSCETEKRGPYTCHSKPATYMGKLAPHRWVQKRVVRKIGVWQNRRLTPPVYRDHVRVQDMKREDGGAQDEDETSGPGKRQGGSESDLFKILASECMEQLYDDNVDQSFGSVEVLAFGRLHHMNLHYFEAELAAELADVVEKKTTDRRQMLRIRRSLRAYSEAIQDYNIVLDHWKQPRPHQLTPFQKVVLPKRFKTHIARPHKKLDGCNDKKECKHASWDNGCITLSSGNPWGVALVSRIAAALLGSLAFIVPLLIMVVHDAPKRNLITTSVFVVVAAVVLACTSLGTWKDVLGITAAYAAVLIVFVGTSSAETGS